MIENANTQKNEDKNANVVDKIMEHQVVKDKVEELSNQKAELLLKRNEFLSKTANENVFDQLEKYKTVAEDEYFNLKKNITQAKNNISKLSMEEIDNIQRSLQTAFNIEQQLQNQLNSKLDIAKPATAPVVDAPEGLDDILNNPQAYEHNIINTLRSPNFNGDTTNIYSTQNDFIKYDLNSLDRTDGYTVKQLTKINDDYINSLERNSKYKNFIEIL